MSTLSFALDVHHNTVATYGDVITAVFQHGVSTRTSVETERDLIGQAQDGDQTAAEILVLIYGSALAANHHARPSHVPAEDSVSALLARFWELVQTIELDRYDTIGNTVAEWLRDASAEAQAEQWSVRVPTRTLKRFWGIVRKAGGDFNVAADLAPQYEMSADTFWSVWQVVVGRRTADPDVLYTQPRDDYAALDDYMAAHAALRALDGRELDVSRHAYGFVTGDPMTDGEIVEAMSERDLPADEFARGDRVVSRPTVQRERARGLERMRAALAVD